MCVRKPDLSRTSLKVRKRAAFVVAVPSMTDAAPSFKKFNRVKLRGGKGVDESQTGMDREAEFSGLGLHGMRMGV
jgi:hypothetical protein